MQPQIKYKPSTFVGREEFFEWLNTCPSEWKVTSDLFDYLHIVFKLEEDDDEVSSLQ